MLLALVLQGITLLAPAGAQTIATGGGADAALTLLEDGDAGPVILNSQRAGFGENLLPLGFREPGSVAAGLQGSAGLGLNGAAQAQHQG